MSALDTDAQSIHMKNRINYKNISISTDKIE